MAMRNPYQQYRQSQILTTPPEELVIMLYDGAIRFIRKAKNAIEQKDIEQVHNNLVRAEEIISELMSNLDMRIEVSSNLYSLYDYIYNRLTEANLQKDPAILDEVLALIQDLRDTWDQAIKIARQKA